MSNTNTPLDPAQLQARHQQLLADRPGLRIRDAARELGVAEAQLLASRCGHGVRRLQGDWGGLVRRLKDLGEVMALTRNEHAVSEIVGHYTNASVAGNMGLVLDPLIDLRLFLGRWHYGFAVEEAGAHGPRSSLQFFDIDGVAVHKVYLTEASDVGAYQGLVGQFLAADQSPAQAVHPLPPPEPPRPDAQIDVRLLREQWLLLRDTHDFDDMLSRLGVRRAQAMRLAGPDLACAVDVGSLRTLLVAARDEALPVMVFVDSPGVVQIHTGEVKNIKPMDGWVNVMDLRFSLHVREAGIAHAYVVRKPTLDGVVTALELYDSGGGIVLRMFGKRKPGIPENPAWRRLVEGLVPQPLPALAVPA